MTAIEQVPLIEVRTPSGRKSRANYGMSEAQLLAAVRRLAGYTGWLCYHTADSRRSEPGYPDCTLVHVRQRRVMFVELKVEGGKTSPAQDEWLAALAAAGAEVYLWRPEDLARTIPAVLNSRPILKEVPEDAR